MVSNEEIRRNLGEKRLHPDRPYSDRIKDLSGDKTVPSEELKRKYAERMGNKKKGYLVCESCGGYYELQKGESLEDFDRCQCGGDLTYYASLNEIEKQIQTKICSKCGTKNIDTAQFCQECGTKLVN
jgi:ribosomal protein L40E